MRNWYAVVSMTAAMVVASACADSPTSLTSKTPPAARAGLGQVSGAGYTTFTIAAQCVDGNSSATSDVDCNNYASKAGVYMSGGPTGGSGLSAGSYFFAVLDPSGQNTLPYVLYPTGKLLSQDAQACRTFTKNADGTITYDATTAAGCTTALHAMGITPYSLKSVVQLIPYLNTPNNGGVYILAICQVGAVNSSSCKFDAFRIRNGEDGPPPPPPNGNPLISGRKYYDTNRDGIWTPGEAFISGWAINVQGSTVYTDANGDFTKTVTPGSYLVNEFLPTATTGWVQTGNIQDKSGSYLNSVAFHLTANGSTWPAKSYTVTAVLGGTTTGLDFGNVCSPNPGGHTLGFWSNKNGLALVTQTDINNLNAFYLRNGAGADQNWVGILTQQKTALNGFLLSANASNMANMLSAQMTATFLSTQHTINGVLITNGAVNIDAAAIPSALLVSSGTGLIPDAEVAGLGAPRTVSQNIQYANILLRYYPITVATGAARTEEGRVKNIFDAVNNNLSFFQSNLADALALCGAPFPPVLD